MATLSLNGTEIGRTANQHRSYRFDVTGLLVEGENTLTVAFEGPVTAGVPAPRGDGRPAAGLPAPLQRHPQDGRRLRLGLGHRHGRGRDLEGDRDRVVESAYGWHRFGHSRSLDGTVGVLRDARGTGAGPTMPSEDVELDGHRGRTVRRPRSCPPGCSGRHAEHRRIPEVERWWPRGYGAQRRYPVSVTGGARRRGPAQVGFRTRRAAHRARTPTATSSRW